MGTCLDTEIPISVVKAPNYSFLVRAIDRAFFKGDQEESNWNERNARHHKPELGTKHVTQLNFQNKNDILFPNLQFQHMVHLHIYRFYKFRLESTLKLKRDSVLVLVRSHW